ncbi:hypothetical protein AB6F61_15225 [Providencia hangzhouensis]|uniref:hypothetical protein n=1 Tax=Providencia hangzhouensis TaxID=3031799 RepID=UPI0034DDAF2E
MVIIEAIVESLYQIILFSPVVRKNVKMVSNIAFTAIGGYGRFEQAAIAAEQLVGMTHIFIGSFMVRELKCCISFQSLS